jgi:thiol-disulfide isomerase/thioredoxin
MLAAVLFAAGCNTDAPVNPAAARAAEPPKAEVKLDLKNIVELEQLVASKKGKLVVLDAWSTYCEPCMKEFPGLVALHKKYGPEKVACISLCANYTGVGKPEDEIAEPLAFLKDKGAVFDNVFCTEADTKLYEKLKFASVPTIFVYDREGKLIKTFDGEPTYADVEKFLSPLVQ